MAGSLNHITADDGSLTFELLDGQRDMAQALHECHQIIAFLVDGKKQRLTTATDALNFPRVKAVPLIGPAPWDRA